MNGNYWTSSLTHNVIVIGAGVAGLSTALALQRRGYRLILLERGSAGGESSWAGAGILSPLLPWDYSEPVNALALRSMAAYGRWVAEIEAVSGLDTEFWRCGMLILNPTTRFDHLMAWCTTHGMIAEHHPARNALRLPDVAQIRNPRLVAALRATVVKQGGEIREHCEAIGVHTRGSQVTAVETRAGPLAAERVVLATGAWAGLGLRSLAAMPQIRPIRGQMLLFKLPPGELDTILYQRGVYLIPRRDGHVLVGSTLEEAGFDKSIDDAARQRLHAEAARLLPPLSGLQPIRHWAGLRPGSPDNIPVIDRHPDYDNVFVNVGHYRYGVTMAPASAELLVDLMTGTAPALDPTPYRWQAALERRWPARP